MANSKVVVGVVAPVIFITSACLILIAMRITSPPQSPSKSLSQFLLLDGFETTSAPCRYEAIVGDGMCDDDANNILCEFDGNDCCQEQIYKYYCSKCICHLDGLSRPSVVYLSDSCLHKQLVGDGYCSDLTLECDYDSGDCCLPEINRSCNKCICHEDGLVHPSAQELVCWPSDLACDDLQNVADCNYDNGDCCLPYIVTDFCVDCMCHEDGTRHEDISKQPFCPHQWRGDGICDDDSNREECGFDHGDCCLPSINQNYCIECLCHQTGKRHRPITKDDCEHVDKIGDGFCNDESNIYACYFDGGDCCLSEVINTNCAFCVCTKFHYSNPNNENMPSSGGQCMSYLSAFVGDGVCEDENNNPSCDYDGGDCCLKKIFPYCSQCICHLDGSKHYIACFGEVFRTKLADGICQDYVNVEECFYDAWDCCKPVIYIDECNDCICHLDGERHEGKSLYEEVCPGTVWHLGDFLCQDGLNTESCDYDHGDCCLPIINAAHCSYCICHLDGTRHPTSA